MHKQYMPTSSKNILDFKWWSEEKRFVEVMYFGGRIPEPTALQELYLGLACCASIRSVAEVENMIAAVREGIDFPANNSGLLVGRGTKLVNEGVIHLLKAMDQESDIKFPESSAKIVADVMNDVQDYARQDFKAFPLTELGYSLKTAAYAAILLLHQLSNQKHSLNDMQAKAGADLIELLKNHNHA